MANISSYVNVTNQPIFSNGKTRDNQITLLNTTLSTGENAPVGIHGKIRISPPYFYESNYAVFDFVHGIKVDVAFVERPSKNCSDLKGWHSTGSGD